MSSCTPRELCDQLCEEMGVVCMGGEGKAATMCVSVPVQVLRQQVSTDEEQVSIVHLTNYPDLVADSPNFYLVLLS